MRISLWYIPGIFTPVFISSFIPFLFLLFLFFCASLLFFFLPDKGIFTYAATLESDRIKISRTYFRVSIVSCNYRIMREKNIFRIFDIYLLFNFLKWIELIAKLLAEKLISLER